MTIGSGNPMPRGTLWVLAINTAALIAFASGPTAEEYPLAAAGILAVLFAQLCLPACRIQMAAPLCPANIAQGYYWIQLVLVTVLVGHFGFSQGVLPYLPSKDSLNLAIAVHVVGYLSFCVAYQCFSPGTARRDPSRGSMPGTAFLIVPFAVVGVVGFLLAHGGLGGFLDYVSSPIEQRLREEEATTLEGAAGNFLKHFLGFAVVLAWSSWHGRARRRMVPIVLVSTAVVVMLLVANFNYNRGTMLGPVVGLAAAFSLLVRRIPFKGVVLAGVLALSIAFAFGSYRASGVDVTEMSASVSAEMWNAENIVEFVQIYASAPQLSAYLIEALEGTFYYGKTVLPSLAYPIPVLGKPYRDASGPVIFNEAIYGKSEPLDQVIPLNGELYINLHLAGVIIGNVLLGGLLVWLQGKFIAAPNLVETYAWAMMALWTVFPGSLSVTSQIYMYSFWPIYTYFIIKRALRWSAERVSDGEPEAVRYS
ncbi:MAG TPA: hypothetical protein VKJ67_23380 [Methylomirabilota bacterium]|nr:hypothetical protein [Methylomirabilota bacterium]